MSVRFQSAYKLLLYLNNSTIFFYTKPRNYKELYIVYGIHYLAQILKLLKVADFQIKYYDHTSICQSKIKYLGIEWVSDCCLTPTRNRYIPSLFIPKYYGLVGCGFFMVFNATFNNIVAVSFITPGGNHRPASSHWQTLSHNVVHLTLSWIWTHNISGDRHRIYNGQGKIRPG